MATSTRDVTMRNRAGDSLATYTRRLDQDHQFNQAEETLQ